MGAIVVVTTVGTEEQANLIAREIIARRHGACVNIVPGVRSFYRWKGKICQDGELMLVVKTLDEEFESVAATIRELHSYELPEILSFQVARGEQRFLDWLGDCLDKDAALSAGDEDDDDEDGEDDEEDEVAYAIDLDDSSF
jgi:periplasmic divalent cation tolerance protein